MGAGEDERVLSVVDRAPGGTPPPKRSRSRKGYTSSSCPLGLVARATAGAEVVAFETDEGVVANGLFEGIEEMEEALVERRRPGVLDRTETIKGLTD